MDHNPPAQVLAPPATWQWQSNTDIWSNEKIEWTSYSKELNKRLEKAYSLKVEEVDLKNGYIVNLKHMLQICQADKQHQRNVRRVYEEGFDNIIENSRKKRYFGVEIPKRTYVSPFGSVQDYLNFFQNRDSHIQEFVTIFTQIEQSSDINTLNNKIVPLIVAAIQREAEFLLLENKIKNININSGRKELVELFTNNKFSTLLEFYKCILKVYTLNSFMFVSLNWLLRQEDWPRLENLLPYAFCLCKAFLHPYFSGHHLFESLKKSALKQGNARQDFIELYRGTALSEELLEFYDPEKIKYFSWSSVTSTTKIREKADFFMEKKEDTDILVLFIIQVPLDLGKQAKEALIDIKSCSNFPEEEEVILAPGSIFELIKPELQAEKKKITIRLVEETNELKLQGILMQGVFNSEIGKTGKDFLLTHLQGRELEEALLYLTGNKLIERLEINSCNFTERTGKLLNRTLNTIQNLKNLKLFANSSDDGSYEDSLEEMAVLNFENLELYDQYGKTRLSFALNQYFKNVRYLKSLNLSFRDSQVFDSGNLEDIFKGIKPCDTLKNLCLDFTSVKLRNENDDSSLQSLCEALKCFPSLLNLDINFDDSKLESDWLICLFEGIKTLVQLKDLRIIMPGSIFLNHDILASLSQSLVCLKDLESLKLRFGFNQSDGQIGMYHLGEGIANLPITLKTLHLRVEAKHNYQKKIEVDMLPLLAGILALKNLKDLDLHFLECCYDRLVQTVFEGIATLPSLTCFGLKLNGPEKITNSAFIDLPDKMLALKSLTSLTLYLCNLDLSNDGAQLLANGLLKLNTLTTLNLIMTNYNKITESGFANLFKALKSLSKLNELTLDFEGCSMSSVGLQALAIEIGRLISLVSLNLSLRNCSKITNEGLQKLSEEIKSLSSLQTFELDISQTKNISDEGMMCLAQGLQTLKKLTNITIDARGTKGVSKKGYHKFAEEIKGRVLNIQWGKPNIKGQRIDYEREINNVKQDALLLGLQNDLKNVIEEESYMNETIKSKSALNSIINEIEELESIDGLVLTFEDRNTNDKDLERLSEVIQGQEQLKILKLNFTECKKITDDGLIVLSTSIRGLSKLKHLAINLSGTYAGDDGVEALCQAIGNLGSLLKLKLYLRNCAISDERNLFNFGEMAARGSLISLNISLFACSSMSDQSVYNLFEDLRALKSLRDFRLRFGESELSDLALMFLSEEIGELKNLNRLKLKIIASKDIDDIGDEGFEYLSRAIKQLAALQVLELNFSWTGLTDEGLAHFSRGMRSLGELRKLDFRFQGVDSVSGVGEESLKGLLRYLGFTQFR